MNTQTILSAAKLAQKIRFEKKFIVDFSYPINKPTTCILCHEPILKGKHIRVWVEIGRRLYTDWINGNSKGFTICNCHSKKNIMNIVDHLYVTA